MAVVKTHGIVLSGINLGEADKIITLLTDKLGKVKVVVHGARKAKSRFMSSTQVFAYCEYVLYKGKNLYTLSQSEIKESFQGLLNDLYTLTYGSYIIELIDALTQEDEKNIGLFVLLLKTLYLMSDNKIDRELLVRTFEIKAVSISGYMPNIYRCSVCKSTKNPACFFSIKHGGLLCSKCADNDISAVKLNTSTINALKYLLRTDIEKIGGIKASPLIKKEMKKVLKSYIEYYLERKFKSLDFLDAIESIDNL